MHMESIASKPRIVIVSNRADASCGIAAYTRVREEAFKQFFDVTVLDLQSATLMRPPNRRQEADLRIDQICGQLPRYDLTVLDSEFGIWGGTLDDCARRLARCCSAAKRLILTMHRVDTDGEAGGSFAHAQVGMLSEIARRDADRPYCLITHSKKEEEVLRSVHGLANVQSHPLCFVTKEHKSKNRAPNAWKMNLGLTDDDQAIGVFGSFSKYKDYKCVLRALSYLPQNYKLVFVGGAHPFSRKPFEYDDSLFEIVNLIDHMNGAGRGIEGRVLFLGVVDDGAFLDAMSSCDFIVAPYHDGGQFSSGVASMAFEMGKRVVATNNGLFGEYLRFYGDCFERFDIGNHFELRDKIVRFDTTKARRVEESRDLYTPESMGKLHRSIFEQLADPAYRNNAQMDKITSLVKSLRPTIYRQVTRKGWTFVRLSLSDPQRALMVLKREVGGRVAKVPRSLTGLARRLRVSVPLGVAKAIHRKVIVRRFNTLLDDRARRHFSPAISTLWRIAPDVMGRKIRRANVQQGFMLAAVEQLVDGCREKKMLCVGSFEDTACCALQGLGYQVDAIDPSINNDLASFRRKHPELSGTYHVVFSTSVIEHVIEDEAFVSDIVAMLVPGGYAVLTCDYRDGWAPGQPKPSSDVKIYTHRDMQRLIAAMGDVELVDEPDWQDHVPDFIISEGSVELRYGFASLAVQRRPASATQPLK